MSAYKLIGQRYLRKYTEKNTSPVYAAAVEARKIVDSLCDLEWESVKTKDAQMTYHTEEQIDGKSGLDLNVDIRDSFDAALFCAGHSAGQHRAYANAAVYRYTLPDSAIGVTLTALKANVTSDPYNSLGARIHIFTNSTGVIPKNCRDVRGEDSSGEVIEDGTTAIGFAPRTSETVSGKEYWYPTSAQCTLSPTGGLVLQKYLFIAVLMESYSTVRGNWLEGCSFISNDVEIETDSEISDFSESRVNKADGIDNIEDGVVVISTYSHANFLNHGVIFSVGTVRYIRRFTSHLGGDYIFCIGTGGQSSLCGDGDIIESDVPGVVLYKTSNRSIIKARLYLEHSTHDRFDENLYRSYHKQLANYLINEDNKFYLANYGDDDELFSLSLIPPFEDSPNSYILSFFFVDDELRWSCVPSDGRFMDKGGNSAVILNQHWSPAKTISDHVYSTDPNDVFHRYFSCNAGSSIIYIDNEPALKHNGQFVRVTPMRVNSEYDFEYLIYGDFTEIANGETTINAPSGFVVFGRHMEGDYPRYTLKEFSIGNPDPFTLPRPNNYDRFRVQYFLPSGDNVPIFLYSGNFTKIGDSNVNGFAKVIPWTYTRIIDPSTSVDVSCPMITPINYKFDGEFFVDTEQDGSPWRYYGKLIRD